MPAEEQADKQEIMVSGPNLAEELKVQVAPEQAPVVLLVDLH